MPSKWDDQRPPDTYGLDYTGAHCRGDRHEKCPGYWGDQLRPGQGTRCACPCHAEPEQLTILVITDIPERFTR
jgi:hypothetical protein